MASTVTFSHHFKSFKMGTVNLGTYATGGVAVSGAAVDCPIRLYQLVVFPSAGYIFEYVGGLVKAYRQKDPAAAGGADIPLPEVANGVDLSAVNVPFLAMGH